MNHVTVPPLSCHWLSKIYHISIQGFLVILTITYLCKNDETAYLHQNNTHATQISQTITTLETTTTMATPKDAKLWGGRFTGTKRSSAYVSRSHSLHLPQSYCQLHANLIISGKIDPLMMKYNASIQYDRAFFSQDIAGSIAYARANSKIGILTSDEFSQIEQGLRQVGEEWRSGKFEINEEVDEDIHTANERRLGEIIDKNVAGKLHTGRSRNDQVATDMRLWLRDQLKELEAWLKEFLQVTASRAEKEVEYVMPGYTHLQRAQPIRWSHWMLAHGAAFATDLQRLREVIKRVNRSPLGCGALAGNPFGIDREAIAKELGFETLIYNSMSGVGDRDFVVETMQWGATFMMHISRWAEDLIIYSSAEFGFVKLADAYSTGSSLMPQKKNPDSLELLRGKSGRAFGQMAGLMMSVKGIPSTYNKDLQESVEPLLDHIKTVGDSIQIATGVLSTLASTLR